MQALCYGTGDDGRKSAGKGKLEEPIFESNELVSLEKKGFVPNKGLSSRLPVATVGESVSDGPEGDSASAAVEKIPQNHLGRNE